MPPAVEGAEGEVAGLKSVALAASAVNKDGPCVSWTSLRRHAVSGPDRGDLAIVLPDDEASPADASVYRAQREQLFAYEPRPAFRSGCVRLFATLSAIFA